MSDWISVKDQMPAPGTLALLVRISKKGPVVSMGFKADGEWWYIAGSRVRRITHWMPLPELPKEDQTK